MEEIRGLSVHEMGENDSLGYDRSLPSAQIFHPSRHHLRRRLLHRGRRRRHYRAALQGEVLGRTPRGSCASDDSEVLYWSVEGVSRRRREAQQLENSWSWNCYEMSSSIVYWVCKSYELDIFLKGVVHGVCSRRPACFW
ncbi:unnamed protein product [Linum tenue]|uniref:Uncharacterized protein n=1 Tax=Linum tenue TaxID=586396 RepID=A0AAV0NCL5_9ROSI|nr:unnamed protein product [Linum tenue]